MPKLDLNKSQGTKKFAPAAALEADTYMARVVQVITVGKQDQRPYKGEEKAPTDEVQLTYELVSEFLLDADGNPDPTKPRWVSEFVPIRSLDSDLAKLTKRYKAIDPKNEEQGDLFGLIGNTCMVTLTKSPGRDGLERNYVSHVGAAPKGIPFPELVNEPRVFHVDDPDLEVFKDLPEWLQKKMTEDNRRYQGSALQAALEGKAEVKTVDAPSADPVEPIDDDLPF